MKLSIVLVLAVLVSLGAGEIVQVFNPRDVDDVRIMHKDDVVVLFFINPHATLTQEEESASFWESLLTVVDSIKGIFVSS